MKYNSKIYRRITPFKSRWGSVTFGGITGRNVTMTLPKCLVWKRKPRLKKRRR